MGREKATSLMYRSSSSALRESVLSPRLFLPLRYDTRERLMSSEARAGWVTPDLRDLEVRLR